jgi:hypothetical protein
MQMPETKNLYLLSVICVHNHETESLYLLRTYYYDTSPVEGRQLTTSRKNMQHGVMP